MLTEVIPQVFGFQSFGTAPKLNASGSWLQGSEVFGGSSRVQQLIGVAIRIWRLGHSGHSDTSCSCRLVLMQSLSMSSHGGRGEGLLRMDAASAALAAEVLARMLPRSSIGTP